MYCPNCGAASGGSKFCRECGASLRQPPAPVDPTVWKDEARFDEIVAIPAVRASIATAAAGAKRPIDVEEWLHRMDHAQPGHPYRAGMAGGEFLISVMARKGIASGKEHSQLLPGPVGWVLVDMLRRLARLGYALQQVHQGADGCTLECTIPPSIYLLKGGEIAVTVTRASGGTQVTAVTNFPGVLRDGGYSRRIFRQIFPDYR